MKKFFLTLIGALLLSAAAYSQDASRISEILKTNKVTYGQAAYVAGVFSGDVKEDASYSKAFEALAAKGLVPAQVKAGDAITLADFSYICAKTTGMKGGLFYNIFDNSRYAIRELKAKGIVSANADPDFTVDGHEALSVLSNCIEATGAN